MIEFKCMGAAPDISLRTCVSDWNLTEKWLTEVIPKK